MTAEHIPDILLERYRLNELPAGDRARIAERLGRDAELRERLAALDASDDALCEPIDCVRSRLATRARPPRPIAVAWAVSAFAATLAVVVAMVWRANVRPSSDERIKGSGAPSLTLYRRTPDGSEQLADGAVARAGDLIRVGYRAAGHAYGLIVSIDGAGAVTMHLPAAGDRAVALQRDAMVLLDQAYELDDAPRWERFFFVAGDAPFDAAPVVRAVRDAVTAGAMAPRRDLALPRGLTQTGFTLQKESRR